MDLSWTKLAVHFHMLFLDGVYVRRPDGSLRYRWVKAPSGTDLTRQKLGRLWKFIIRPAIAENDCGFSRMATSAFNASTFARGYACHRQYWTTAFRGHSRVNGTSAGPTRIANVSSAP
jgi:hypothetical protein